MGLFDFFSSDPEKQMKRHTKRIKNLNAQGEDRQMSAYWLADIGTDQAIMGLLGRFTITYEHRMKDNDEKSLVVHLLEELGPKVVPVIRQWVLKNPAFAKPLNVVDKFEGEDVVVDILLEMLGVEVDPFKPEKKRQILIRLADYKDERIITRVAPSLEDFDEGIRYAAAEVLLAQDTDSVRMDLAAALANRQEESNRLRVRIAEAFRGRSWRLGEHAEAVAERPPGGWVVAGDQIRPA